MSTGNLFNFRLSQYETKAYIALLANNPVNGSQLSRYSGIPRARIYDVLSSLTNKGMAVEVSEGLYAPLPKEEVLKRFRARFDSEISILEKKFDQAEIKTRYDYVWNIYGYEEILSKARDMIGSAKLEIYVRLFPEEAKMLDADLNMACQRQVQVKYISMGEPPSIFDLQVIHPGFDEIERELNGRTFDIVVDRKEALVGLFENDNEPSTSWAKNHWFVIAARDSLRHDFFHYFFYKIYELGEELTRKEAAIYETIKKDTLSLNCKK